MKTLITRTPFQPGPPFVCSIGFQRFQLRSLDHSADLSLLYSWACMPYAREFWGMALAPEAFWAFYSRVLLNPGAHSYLGLLQTQPVCQLEVYDPFGSELARSYPALPGDLGIHLLMGPDRRILPGISWKVLRRSLEFLFSFPRVLRIIAEPDTRNRAAHIVALRAGFHYWNTIFLKEKAACLYGCCREEFFSNSIPVGI